MTEVWRDVPGYVGHYTVSDSGLVWSSKRTMHLKPTLDAAGYSKVTLRRENVPSIRFIHRLVLEAFEGPAPLNQMQGRHLDGDPANNAFSNLAWGSGVENAADMRRHGTHNFGRRTVCARRGHDLIAPNLEKWSSERGHRKCYSCCWARAIANHARRHGRPIPDVDWLADAYYEFLMCDGPDPRWKVAVRPPAAPGDRGPLTLARALRDAFSPGVETSPTAAVAPLRALGLDSSRKSIASALSVAAGRGEFVKLGPGRYRRAPAA